MRRREFMSLLGAVAAWPLIVYAQPANKNPKIGVLWLAGSTEEETLYRTSFREGLSVLGYLDGRNVTVLNTFAAEQYERFNSNAVELTKANVDVLVAVTRQAALAAQRATRTIPIIFVFVPDPVDSGLVASLARPGGNVTGFTQIGFELSGKRLEIFKETTGLSRGALLANVSEPDSARRNIEEFQTAARALQVSLDVIEVRKPDDLHGAFDLIAQKGLGGVLTLIDPMFFNERRRIAEFAITRRIAAMGHIGEMTKDGLLISYAANYPAMFRRIGIYIDKILRGEKPADLPVEQPTKFELVINLKTAKAIGLSVPPLLLSRADEVIE